MEGPAWASPLHSSSSARVPRGDCWWHASFDLFIHVSCHPIQLSCIFLSFSYLFLVSVCISIYISIYLPLPCSHAGACTHARTHAHMHTISAHVRPAVGKVGRDLRRNKRARVEKVVHGVRHVVDRLGSLRRKGGPRDYSPRAPLSFAAVVARERHARPPRLEPTPRRVPTNP